ncbi:fasciclin domain-containing protein [Glaciecola sp. KUL10]|uniref:fasciclin domain-containing protein n=1 Tax=Glaciecola sp. (strain KUL10) TaxID=2161813 RepID=UPI000D781B5F|nr:fasciclin domain-containing protein [Glaciecola sp. KUL10]GBL06037.1 adhesion lipoprotein [Glaciecola sp. KUL10]
MARLLKLGIAVGMVTLLSGCDLFDDDDDAVEVVIPPVVEPAPEPVTIVDTAVANGSFTTLVAALQATGLDATLDDADGNFTVFAPTDAAFELLGEETINALLNDTDSLSEILTYHVLDSQVDSTAAIGAAGTTVATVNGASLGLSLSGDNLLVNTSTVTTVDIMTDNGIIHVIDAVLMPPMPTDASAQTIAEVAVGNPDLSTLVIALQTADLVGALSDPDAQFTVFAPTNAAFAMIDPALLEAILADSDALTAILLQHVVSGAAVDAINAFALSGTSVETMSGAMIPIAINPETDSLTVGGANVTVTDIQTANGIVHVIDMVIVGDVELPTPVSSSIVDVAVEAGSFTTLMSLLRSTGLDTVLADLDTEFTVFAPTDAAFAQVDEATLAALANDADALTNVLTYHVISGATILQDAAVSVAQSDMRLVEMTNGQNAALSLGGSTLYVNTSAVSTADVMADNGVIHIVDQVILPPTPLSDSELSIVDIALANPEFSTLVAALTAADLVSTLADEAGQFTVFAPTNAAFDKIPDATLDALLADTDSLSQVLLQHVVSGATIDSVGAYAANGANVDTVSGEDVAISIVNYAQTTDSADAEVAYDAVSNLLVGGSNSAQPGFTLYVFDNDLGTAGSACNDACSENWPPVLVTDGMASGIPGLSAVMREDGSMQATFLGRPLYFFASDVEAGDTNGDSVGGVWFAESTPQTVLNVQGATVTVTDIAASNGVIHVIDTVITETLE